MLKARNILTQYLPNILLHQPADLKDTDARRLRNPLSWSSMIPGEMFRVEKWCVETSLFIHAQTPEKESSGERRVESLSTFAQSVLE